MPPLSWSRLAGPLHPTSFKEALQQRADIEKRLNEFKDKAKQDMQEALKWGNDEAIKKANYNWWIVTSAVNDTREENRVFNKSSPVEQVIYGKEEEKKRWGHAWEAHECRLDKLWRQLKDMYPDQEGKGSKPPVWQKPRGWIQEWKSYYGGCYYQQKKIIQNLFMMWSEKKDIKTSRKLAGFWAER